jgi:hypothetical protein
MTAIEWLEEQLPIRIKNSMYSEIKEAKEKEKEQITDAATWGFLAETGEQYYKLKYKKEL